MQTTKVFLSHGAREALHRLRITHKVQTTIIRHESGDLLSVLDELDSNTFSDSRVGLFGFDTDLSDVVEDEGRNGEVKGEASRVSTRSRYGSTVDHAI